MAWAMSIFGRRALIKAKRENSSGCRQGGRWLLRIGMPGNPTTLSTRTGNRSTALRCGTEMAKVSSGMTPHVRSLHSLFVKHSSNSINLHTPLITGFKAIHNHILRQGKLSSSMFGYIQFLSFAFVCFDSTSFGREFSETQRFHILHYLSWFDSKTIFIFKEVQNVKSLWTKYTSEFSLSPSSSSNFITTTEQFVLPYSHAHVLKNEPVTLVIIFHELH